MKNIIRTLFIAAVLAGSSSCDLDKLPYSSIPEDEAVQTINDVRSLRRGCYATTKGAFGSGTTIIPDIQADYLLATRGNSNTYTNFQGWIMQSSDTDMTALWASYFNGLANVNFLLDRIGQVQVAENEKAEITRIEGELHLLRAMVSHQILLRFCKDYEPETATTDLGIPIMRHYLPPSTSKPARGTMAESYAFILEDIEFAKTALANVPGAPNSETLTIDCVTALEAKVYLQMHMYAEAAAAADALISGPYSLCQSSDEFKQMWETDNGNELIFRYYASNSELGATQYGIRFLEDPARNGLIKPDYIPTKEILSQYDATNDIRYHSYFKTTSIQLSGQTINNVVVMNKYPGNPDLRQTSSLNNYCHKVKVHRLADFYLIAAEAYAQNPATVATGSERLNALRMNRINGWVNTPYATQEALMAEIKKERVREMYMEGTRLIDLKRWHDPMERGTGQQADWVVTNYEGLYKAANDNRFVWGIPLDEINANKNIAGQQNPGW